MAKPRGIQVTDVADELISQISSITASICLHRAKKSRYSTKIKSNFTNGVQRVNYAQNKVRHFSGKKNFYIKSKGSEQNFWYITTELQQLCYEKSSLMKKF
jgi:hypothetical protein